MGQKPLNPAIQAIIIAGILLVRLIEFVLMATVGMLVGCLMMAVWRWGWKRFAVCSLMIVVLLANSAMFPKMLRDLYASEQESRQALMATIWAETEEQRRFDNLLWELSASGELSGVESIYQDENGEYVVEFSAEWLEEKAFWQAMAAYKQQQEEEQARIEFLLATDEEFALEYYLQHFPQYAVAEETQVLDELPEATIKYVLPESFTIGGGVFSATNNNQQRYQNVSEFFEFWDAKGLTLEGICGLAGNWFKEYSFYVNSNPYATDNSHFGMWQLGRTYNGQPAELFRLYENQYVDRNSLETQCQFVYDIITGKWDERLTVKYGHVWDLLMEAESAAEAARIFNRDFEKGGHTENRARHAGTIYEQLRP
ncbi:phage tail tip lysozyme [Candidatus Saccharibacteria bacterium]|nr:phage tail tip lysozyme [Candidatus Saccharibacteria bacterium]